MATLISALTQFNLPQNVIDELKNIKKGEHNFKDNIKKWINDLPFKLGDKMLDALSLGTLVKIIASYAGIKL
jgi:hypothetical protein